MPFANIRDIGVFYELKGAGPRLLYISGSGGDLRNRPNHLDGPLTQHFQVLAYDQRGLGQTDKPALPYSMSDYAEDARVLLDVIGWDTCFVMGVSFGGMVAQELAVRYPKRVERLVLCCTSSGGAGGSSYPLHELFNMEAGERAVFRLSITDSRRDEEWQARNPEIVQQAIDSAQQTDALRGYDPAGDIGYRRQLEARAKHDAYERLGELRMPVFLAGGRYDRQAPPKNMEAIRDRIPGAQLEFFEGGHGFLREDDRAMQRIIEFLSTNE